VIEVLLAAGAKLQGDAGEPEKGDGRTDLPLGGLAAPPMAGLRNKGATGAKPQGAPGLQGGSAAKSPPHWQGRTKNLARFQV